MQVRFDDAARAELASTRRDGLGVDLMAEVHLAVAAIADSPST